MWYIVQPMHVCLTFILNVAAFNAIDSYSATGFGYSQLAKQMGMEIHATRGDISEKNWND